jgi:hypothetical protein
MTPPQKSTIISKIIHDSISKINNTASANAAIMEIAGFYTHSVGGIKSTPYNRPWRIGVGRGFTPAENCVAIFSQRMGRVSRPKK